VRTPTDQVQVLRDGQQDLTYLAKIQMTNGNFWVYHNQLIDEGIEDYLNQKPEERLWLNVESCSVSEFTFPTFRLRRADVIKLGRVRFKIREIVSPTYDAENARNDAIRDDFMNSLKAENQTYIPVEEHLQIQSPMTTL